MKTKVLDNFALIRQLIAIFFKYIINLYFLQTVVGYDLIN